MSTETEGNLEREAENAKSLAAGGKGTLAIILTDDALADHGFERGEAVEVEIGPVWQGDLAAVLLADGSWHVGYVFLAECGVRMSGARTDYPPRYFHLDDVVAHGRVVRYRSRRLEARQLLPARGVDRIRFRFKL